MNKLKRLWSNLRSSFWFVPSLIVAVSIALAVALVEADSTGSDRWLARWPLLFGGGEESGFIPNLAVSFGVVLAIGGISVLIFFIHHIENSAGKYRRKSRELQVLWESVPVQRSAHRCYKLVLRAVLLGSVCSVLTSTVMAQEPVGKAGEPQKLAAPAKEELSPAPAKVDVNPVARDEEIRKRLQNVLDATDWFINPQARVEEGVVFLKGQVDSDELKKWASDLARIHRPIFYWLALHPGRRPGEAMAIYKEDYNRFKNCFVIKRTISDRKLVEFPKNYQYHEAACRESFEPFIENLLQTEGPFLFVNSLSRREGKRYSDSTLNKLWAKACQEFGVTISLYNGLKHSTLDYYYNDLEVALTDLMDLTGHKNLDCIKHYARMKIRRQKSLLALEKDAPHLKLIHGGKEGSIHKNYTRQKKHVDY